MIGRARFAPRERMRPGRIRKRSSPVMARWLTMCGKTPQIRGSCYHHTVRGLRAHRGHAPKSLGNQGSDRGSMAPHIAALYLALAVSLPSERL